MHILITGFEPFGDIKINPSQVIVDSLAASAKTDPNTDLTAVVLPTEYDRAGAEIARLIREHTPDIVLCLGVSARRQGLHLERVALNLDDAHLPDNAGDHRDGQPILDDAPPAYFSTLPLKDIHTALKERQVPATISNHAGAYVCNHVYYLALHTLQQMQSDALCGFIHVPLPGDGEDTPDAKLQTLGLVKAIEYTLGLLKEKVDTHNSVELANRF